MEDDIIRLANSDTLFHDSIHADLPQLAIVSSEYQKELQIQEDRAFDMEVAVNRSRQNKNYITRCHIKSIRNYFRPIQTPQTLIHWTG